MNIPYFSRLFAAVSRLSSERLMALIAAVLISNLCLLPEVSGTEADTIATAVAKITAVDSTKTKKSVSKKVKAAIALAEEKKSEINTDTLLKTTILPPVRDLTDEVGEALIVEVDDDNSDAGDNISSITISHVAREAIVEHIEDIAIALAIFFGCIIFPFILLIIIISMVLRSRHKFHREQLRTIEKLTRDGYTVPESILNMQFSTVSKRQSYSTAVKWLGVGVGLALFFGVVANFKTAVIFSVFPLVVGAVKMIIYMRFDRYNKTRYNEPAEEPREVFPPQFKGMKNDDLE